MAQQQAHGAAGRIRRWLAIAAVLAAPALAACGDDDGGSSTGAGGGGGGGELSLAVASPADGAQVGESFEVRLEPSVPLGEPDTGRHHVHLYYDGETAEGEYDLVYGDSFTVERLAPGQHEVEAVLANADHSLTDARQTITVEVGEGAAAGSGGSGGSGDGSGGGGTSTTSPASTTSSDGDGGYDY